MTDAFQRAVVRTILSLPSPILRLLAGGGVTWRGGRTLDPRFQLLAAASRNGPTLTAMTPDEARRASARAVALVRGPPEPGVRVEAVSTPGAAGDLAARLYRPDDQDPAAPVMVYAHGGGGVMGDLELSDAFCQILARIARCPVLSVDYRLAPEHRFPAGLEDVLAAYRWARDHADDFGAPAGFAAIGGDSAGAMLAAAALQALKAAGDPQPVLQLLLYPCLDVAAESASMTVYADSFPLPRALIDWSFSHYLGADADPADPRVSPIRGRDLSGLAPAVVAAAGFDPLLDQSVAYARRLREADIAVDYRCYDSLPHGFAAFNGAVPTADVACREIAALVRARLDLLAHPSPSGVDIPSSVNYPPPLEFSTGASS